MEVQYYLQQIVGSLIYLHQTKVIHRDLKLGNLFLNENMEIKLGDFGLASRLEYNEEKKKTICGTPNYIAPEILEGKGHSYEVDVWSVGVIIYTQLIGKPPFETPEVKTTYKKIKACNYAFPEHVTISDNARNLITKILVLDPSKRPTLEEILADPFMSEPIPKTIPRSTLACPPAKTFMDQYSKPSPQASPAEIPKQSASNFQTISKKESEKEISSKPLSKEAQNLKSEANFGSSTSNVRASSKDIKMSKLPPAKEAFSAKKDSKPQMSSEIHVKKWVDYSTKYGLGYLLSDGSTGVYFNDSTKIIIDKNGDNFEYIEKKQGDKADTITAYKISDYPPERELQKKVTLLQHFKNYLYSDSKVELDKDAPPEAGYTYVKKWMKTKHAIMFRLSNKIVQVNFTDKTEIILSSEQKLVTYINLKGEKSEYPLATALDSKNAEMAKRLKYTKEILTHMLNGTNVPANAGAEELN